MNNVDLSGLLAAEAEVFKELLKLLNDI